MISSVVVDTDVVSYLFKGDTRSDLYRPHIAGKVLLISFMTLAELRQWALVKNWGERRWQELETFLDDYAIIHSDSDLCTAWAEVAHNAIRNGRPIDTADAWIAATALHLGLPLITHNRNHYLGVDGLSVISEAP